ncbi:MAG: glycosyltransferase [Methylacidiphilales bacterium]|nr:glycosyltransferase [Candidatus Methylacidiphilales bacterium]NJR17563.1 glycosyltransferase [Calothrix sp. CSU_2_0]
MKIFFLDQSGKPGGAELCLIDIAKPYRDRCLVGLFADGSFRDLLEQNQIPVQILTNQEIQVRKESNLTQGLASLTQLAPLITKVATIAREYDIIYANTQKALVIGALASFLSRRPLVYHLHDILSPEHFSKTNRAIAVNLANRASLIIANSQASKAAFIEAGGKANIVEVAYNGFDSNLYQISADKITQIRQELGFTDKFIIGHFSRLSPWKGQHILIEALAKTPENTTVILVGDALFGEQDYILKLHQQVAKLGLENRVKFLGFRTDIPELMSVCDLIAHTSTAAEPFGRVIVEGMLCGKPVIAAKAGGATEIVEDGINGFLVTPNQPQELSEVITQCVTEIDKTKMLATNARISAIARFDVEVINRQIDEFLYRLADKK